MRQGAEIRWVEASYTAIHHVLTNPVYAGAYAYGKSRQETMLNASGVRGKRVRKLPRSEWQVLIPDHHPGFIDWRTYEANQDRIAQNTRPGPHKASGAVREGSALLQGLAACGRCGRRLHTHYRGRNSAPGYHCPGKILIEGRGVYCLSVGGVQISAGTGISPCFEPSAAHAEGELLTIKKAAAVLGLAPSTLHRLLNAGIIPGEQLTPGAPWRIRLTHDVMARFKNDAGEGFIPMREAMKALGVSRQTVLQRVKRGELDAVHVMRGKQKGLRIKAIDRNPNSSMEPHEPGGIMKRCPSISTGRRPPRRHSPGG